ncbi:MAG: prolipoprotein diacylglyceryl transferase [Sandaracinus sp.]
MIPSFGHLPFLDEDLPAYFVMLTCAFAACTWFAVRWAKQQKLDSEVLIDLSLASVITGVAGARIAHVLFDGFFMDYVHLCTDYRLVDWHITEAQCASEWVQGSWDAAAGVCHPTEQDCWAWIRFWQGGLTWYGGMIGALAYAMYFLRKEGFPPLKALDLGGNVLPLGLFFGRLGCWFGGCCFGQRTDAWWGVSFPAWSPASEQQWRAHELADAGYASLPVIPTQLMEAAGSLLIAAFSIYFVHPRKRFDGQVFCISMSLYALLRFVLEFFRADDRGGAAGLTTSQWIGLGLVAFCAAMWVRLDKVARQKVARLASAT